MNYWYLALIGAGLVLLIFFVNYQYKFVNFDFLNATKQKTLDSFMTQKPKKKTKTRSETGNTKSMFEVHKEMEKSKSKSIEFADKLNSEYEKKIEKAKTRKEVNVIINDIERDRKQYKGVFQNRAFILHSIAKSKSVQIFRENKAKKGTPKPKTYAQYQKQEAQKNKIESNLDLDHLNRKDLKLNQVVFVKWTSNYNQYEGLAEITKLNQATVNVRLIEKIKGYPAGNRLVIPVSHQTTGNGLFKLPQELKQKVDTINSDRINVELSETEYKDRRSIAKFGLKWDRSNSSWRGKINRSNFDKLKPFGKVELDKEFSHDQQIESLIEREENKLERLEKGIKSRERKVEGLKSIQDHEGEFLRMGEPIKVGHHSEKRHRNLITKHNARETKIYETRNEIAEKEYSANIKRRKIDKLSKDL